jgi:hypothetical protein
LHANWVLLHRLAGKDVARDSNGRIGSADFPDEIHHRQYIDNVPIDSYPAPITI